MRADRTTASVIPRSHRGSTEAIPPNHPVRLLGRIFAILLLAVVAGLAVSTPMAAQAALDAPPRDCANVPVDMLAAAGCPVAPTAPAPAPSADQAAPAGEKAQTAGAGEQGTRFGQDEEPTGWAGPIAKDLGQGTQGLAEDLSEKLAKGGLLPKFTFSSGYLTLYAVMFGLGQVIAAAATMVATVKLAERGVESRVLFRQAMIRLLTFTPVAALTPLLVAYASQLGEGLAKGFLSMAADQLRTQLTWLVKALAVGNLASVIVPGGSAVMVGLFLFLVASLLGVLLELAISHYLVFLLALFVPVLYAASINPKWRGGVTKVTGGLLGALLAPAALFLVWVVAFSAVPPTSDAGFFTRAGMLLVGLLLSLAAPTAIGIVLSYVVPAFTGGRYDGTTLSGLAERAGSRVSGGGRPQGPRASRSQRASDASDGSNPGPPVETASKGAGAPGGASSSTAGASRGAAATAAGGASGAAGGSTAGAAAGGSTAGAAAGAAAGPLGVAAALWVGMVDKVRSGAEQVRDTVSSRAAASEQADRGGAVADEPSGGASARSQSSNHQAGETPDTPRGAGGAPEAGRKASEAPDAASPRRADGGSDRGPAGGRRAGAAPAGRDGGRPEAGGLGSTQAGPGFTSAPASGADRPGRGRSDDRGDV